MLRYTIRDILWSMVVIGLGVTLWIQRIEINDLRAERNILQGAITRAGYEVVPNCWIGYMLVRADP